MDRQKWNVYIISLILFFHLAGLHLPFAISTLALALNVLSTPQILPRLKSLFSHKLFWAGILPFLFIALSYFYSEDKTNAWRSIEVRLGLVLFPILIGLAQLNKKQVTTILKSYVLSVFILSVIAFITAAINYQSNHRVDFLYNDLLVSIFNKQAAYFAFYVNLAWLFIIHLWHQKNIHTSAEKAIAFLATFSFLTMQYLLASRMSMVTFVLFTVAAFGFISVKRMTKKQIAATAAAMIFTGLIAVVLFPDVTKRFQSIQQLEFRYDNPNPINHLNGKIKTENWNGLNTRLALWTVALETIIEAPIYGYGVGDVMAVLFKKYEEKNFILAMKHHYSCHSQYLNSWLTAGIFGFISLALYLIIPFANGIITDNWVLIGFIIIVALAFITEILFSRDQGAIILGLMYGVLVISNEKIDKPQTLNQN